MFSKHAWMSQEVSKRLVSVLQGGTLVVIDRDNPYKWPYKWVTGAISRDL